jgi:hypothetical protein
LTATADRRTRRRATAVTRVFGVLVAAVALALSACADDGSEQRRAATTAPVAPLGPLPDDGSAGEGVGEGADPQGALGDEALEEGAESPPALAPDGPAVGVNLLPPVPAGRPGEFGGGVSVVLVGSRAVEVEAHGPGETSGPAMAVTLEVRNSGRAPLDLGAIAVNAAQIDGTPGVPTSVDPAAPFTGSVAPGGAARATYVFRVERPGTPLLVEVHSSQSADIVQIRTD